MFDFDNPHRLNEPATHSARAIFSRRGLLLNAPCPECGEVNSTKPKGYFSNIAHKLSLASLKVAGGIVALDIALLIFTEATNGKYGDGFMYSYCVRSRYFLRLLLQYKANRMYGVHTA